MSGGPSIAWKGGTSQRSKQTLLKVLPNQEALSGWLLVLHELDLRTYVPIRYYNRGAYYNISVHTSTDTGQVTCALRRGNVQCVQVFFLESPETVSVAWLG